MSEMHPEVKVDLVFTIDPVMKTPWKSTHIDGIITLQARPWGIPKFVTVTPDNWCVWKSFYQKSSVDPPFLGDNLTWADSEYISPGDLRGPLSQHTTEDPVNRGHVYIPYLHKVQNAWTAELRKLKANPSKADFGGCDPCPF